MLGWFISAVVGFTFCLLAGMALLIRYLQMGLDSKSSYIVDPKPTENLKN